MQVWVVATGVRSVGETASSHLSTQLNKLCQHFYFLLNHLVEREGVLVDQECVMVTIWTNGEGGNKISRGVRTCKQNKTEKKRKHKSTTVCRGSSTTSQISQILQLIPPWLPISARSSHFLSLLSIQHTPQAYSVIWLQDLLRLRNPCMYNS